METIKYRWGLNSYEFINYGRNYKTLSLSGLSFVLPLDFGLFMFLGMALNSPIGFKYRLRNKLKEIKQNIFLRLGLWRD